MVAKRRLASADNKLSDDASAGLSGTESPVGTALWTRLPSGAWSKKAGHGSSPSDYDLRNNHAHFPACRRCRQTARPTLVAGCVALVAAVASHDRQRPAEPTTAAGQLRANVLRPAPADSAHPAESVRTCRSGNAWTRRPSCCVGLRRRRTCCGEVTTTRCGLETSMAARSTADPSRGSAG